MIPCIREHKVTLTGSHLPACCLPPPRPTLRRARASFARVCERTAPSSLSQWESAREGTGHALKSILAKDAQVFAVNVFFLCLSEFSFLVTCYVLVLGTFILSARAHVSSFTGQSRRSSTPTGLLCLVLGSARLTTPTQRLIHPLHQPDTRMVMVSSLDVR